MANYLLKTKLLRCTERLKLALKTKEVRESREGMDLGSVPFDLGSGVFTSRSVLFFATV
jgi:hypothetical protein